MKINDVRKLLSILNANIANEPDSLKSPNVGAHGSRQQAERIMMVADWCAAQWPGDLVEVTCRVGNMTRSLGAVARKHGRRVKALMLWGHGADNWNSLYVEHPNSPHAEDMKKVVAFKDIIDVIPGRPHWNRPPLCFALVDSMNDGRAYRNDIGMVSHCAGLIAVDDSLWHVAVAGAFLAMSHELQRGAIQHPLCREVYLLPR